MWLLLLLLPLNSSFPWVGKSLSCLEAASGEHGRLWLQPGRQLSAVHGTGRARCFFMGLGKSSRARISIACPWGFLPMVNPLLRAAACTLSLS